jgi:hypothetical protein
MTALTKNPPGRTKDVRPYGEVPMVGFEFQRRGRGYKYIGDGYAARQLVRNPDWVLYWGRPRTGVPIPRTLYATGDRFQSFEECVRAVQEGRARKVGRQELTEQEADVYDFLLRYVQENGHQPSMEEIGLATDRTKQALSSVLSALHTKGYVEQAQGKESRAIKFPQVRFIAVEASTGEPLFVEEE